MEIGAKPKQKKKSAAAKSELGGQGHLLVVFPTTDFVALSFRSRYLHWHETDVKRKRAIGVMVLKHAFTPDEFKKDPTYLFDLKR